MPSWMQSRRARAGLIALSLLGISCSPTSSPGATSPAPPSGSAPSPTASPAARPAAAAGSAAVSQLCGNPAPAKAAPPHHVIMIQMENESQSNIVGSAKAPYQTQLTRQCGMHANMWAISHPSLPNYIAENSGKNVLGTFQDCTPMYSKKTCISADDNLFHQLQASGRTWRGYAEDMPSNCYLLDSGNYAARHNPPAYFTDLHSGSGGAASACAKYDLPMGSVTSRTGRFYSDLAAGKLPTYAFIAPNLIDDAHSSSIQAGDNWLKKIIPLIGSSPNYRSGDTDIVIAYDEGAGADKVRGEDCANQALDVAGKQPSCHIPFIVIAPYEKAGTVSTTFCTLYCFTKTVESLYHLPLLGHAGDAATRNLSADFHLSPA